MSNANDWRRILVSHHYGNTTAVGLQHRYTYIMRTISNIENLMIPLENTIRSILLPALLNGYSCSDMERNLFSLPAKFGGLGIFKPRERCLVEYANSSKMIAGMVADVKNKSQCTTQTSSKNKRRSSA